MQKITGVRALGRALGVSHQAAHKYVNDPRWPFGGGPWPAGDVEKMNAWRASLRRDDADSLTKARTLKAQASAQKDLLEVKIKSGKFHNADECRRRRLLCIHQCKQDLLAIPDSLPADRELQDLVRSRIEDALRQFAAAFGS